MKLPDETDDSFRFSGSVGKVQAELKNQKPEHVSKMFSKRTKSWYKTSLADPTYFCQYNQRRHLMEISQIDYTEHECTCIGVPKRSWKYP